MNHQDWKAALLGLDLPQGDEPTQPATTADEKNPYAAHPRLEVALDRKGRKGKEATIIAGFELSDSEIADIASQLKRRLATGGSSRGGEILIQGDRRAQAIEILKSLGFKIK